MKVTELMIGDYVIPRIFDTDAEPSKIIGLQYNSYKGEDYVDWVDCELWDELSLDDIKPVPLTVEILEKIGFKHDYDVDECVADGGHYITLEGYTYEEEDVLIDYCNGHVKITTDFNGEVIKDMNYVHELQHAMRLCRIDKQIKL